MPIILKVIIIMIVVFLFMFFWSKLIITLLSFGEEVDKPYLRERFGTIMWHSSDKDGIYLGSYNDPDAVDHIYCYNPKAEAHSKIYLKLAKSWEDCSNWYGAVIFREGAWVREREKYDWD